MSATIPKLRQSAFERQRHRCFYCSYLMWIENGERFARVHGLPLRFARHLRCTAEHVTPRRDHGENTAANIVAACLWCNRMRHQGRAHKAPDARAYKAQVSRFVALGKWHPLASSGRGRLL